MSQKQINKKKKKRKEIAKKRVLSRRKQIREERKKEEQLKKQFEFDYEIKNGKTMPIIKEDKDKYKKIDVEKRVKLMKNKGETPIIFVGEKVSSSF
jgi:hypothetical protein